MKLTAKRLRLVGMMILALILFVLPACTKGSDETESGATDTVDSIDASDTTDTVEDSETDTESESETETDGPVYVELSVYSKEDAGAKTDIVLKAADYGVKGDGVTDDGPAISAAVRDAVKQGATLQFESGKTYLILSADNTASVFSSPFALQNADGVTVDGGGSLFKLAPGISYFAMTGSSNIRLANMKFDMTVSPYLVGTVKSVSGATVTYTTDREPYADSYNYANITSFSIEYNEGIQNRPHRFITSMEKTAACEVSATYTTTGHGYSVGDKVFIPNPGIGHVYSEAIYLGYNSGAMTFENIEIRAASSFVSAIKSNDAEFFFENFDLVPDKEDDREIRMVAWRDGFHCKDNRRPIHWHECDVEVIFDDVYNVSGTLGNIVEVNNDGRITVVNDEFYQRGLYVAYDCLVGDVVDIYNADGTTYYGTCTVREVVSNPNGSTTLTFDYGETAEKVKEGCKVGNRETCAPGSTITDCRFTGTFRLLRNIRVERTVFDHLCTWIKVEGGVEGPLPGNIDFIDCTFNGGRLEIGAGGNRLASEIVDIGFWNCTFNGVSETLVNKACTVTRSDAWTEADLFTVKNRKLVQDAVEVIPTELDAENGITYDWTRYTMPIEGASVLSVSNIPDEKIRVILENADAVASHVLVLTGKDTDTRYVLGGLDAAHFPMLHRADAFHVLTIHYIVAEGSGAVGTIGTLAGDRVTPVATGIFQKQETMARATVLCYGAEEQDGLYLDIPAGTTVYIGLMEVQSSSAQNPTDEQLEEGHTFLWSDQSNGKVTIGEDATAMRIDEISDATVKAAIQSAESGFESGMVLHLDRGFGFFTGLTDSSYYIAGRTYNLSLDAYIASPLQPANGTKIYLLAMDGTAGNRVLAEGLFTGEGFYHFELDWTVGNTGEYALNFYVSNTPAAYPDVYIGDFTVTKARAQKPAVFLSREDYYTLTGDDLKNGYTFDFTDGNLMDTGHAYYADCGSLDPKTAAIMKEAGFGDTVYYCNQNFTLQSLPNDLTGGSRIRVTMQIYDVTGNLTTALPRGAFVMLHMQNGVQNSAEVNYKITKSDVDPRIFTLTFESTPPAGTDDLLFYSLTNIEFFIGSVTVKKS